MRLVCESSAEHDHVRRHWRLLRNLLGRAHPITIEIDGAPPVTFPADLSSAVSSGPDRER